jgi:hypothetical protein
MSIDIEYAIKKDIRNNPIVREVDVLQKRNFLRTISLGVLIVAMLLFSAWQHYRMVDYGRQIELLRSARAREEAYSRQLTLNLETLLAPQVLEERAERELHLVAPTSKDTVIIERARASAPDRSVIAVAR